jgi:eukaryotic-like serine/threonine-protein kinase
MQQSTKSDHLLMSLVERVLARPKEDRQAYLQSACGNDNPELFSRVWTYVQAEERMGGFLLDPFDPPVEGDAPFEPGQLVLNRFRIIREIARGGMGIVWEAMDEKMELRVAIKCAKAGFGKQLPPEVRNARDISHPNVCNIFEIHTARGSQGEFDFISMEFLEGETLSDRLRRGPLSNKESLAIALQLCAGLAEAHRSNVVHGDLKSNNVILTAGPDGSLQAVIMDFGLARRQSAPGRISPTEVLAGTPAYMAPELWQGVKPSVASDIYALGVVLWELVSGRKPGDVGTASTLPLNARGAWKLPAWHGRWDGVIARCLEENPVQRFQDADEVARALGPPRSRRWFLTAAAAAVLAIASGVVTYQRATAPPESVRLALLPFTSSSGDSSVSENLLRGTASQLARLKSSPHTKFTFIPVDKAHSVSGATHVLQGTLEQRSEEIKIHAYVTDVRSGVNTKEWTADYKPQEMRYAPGALAGVITGALHLPLAGVATVNAAARADYLAGLSAVRRDSGVDVALASFERAVAADPDSPLTYAGLAEAQWFKYAASRDKVWLDRTTESVRQAETRNPDLPRVHVVAGLLKANAGWYEQATAEYLRAIELEPINGDAYRRLGEAYRKNNQLGEALASFRKAIEVDPQQYRNFQNLGSFYYQRANYEEAAKQFRTAVALGPNEASVHLAMGAVELDLGRLDTAESELRTSIRLHETPRALHTLGLVLMYQKRDAQAIPLMIRALALGPQLYLWWMDLGNAYRRVGRKSDAKRSYSRGLDLAEADMAKNPRIGVVRAGLAYLCAQLGDRRRAEFEIAQALQQSPDADTRWMAVTTYEALGHRDDTLSVLATSPSGVIADISRWPDVADLHKDSRFIQLLASHPEK